MLHSNKKEIKCMMSKNYVCKYIIYECSNCVSVSTMVLFQNVHLTLAEFCILQGVNED